MKKIKLLSLVISTVLTVAGATFLCSSVNAQSDLFGYDGSFANGIVVGGVKYPTYTGAVNSKAVTVTDLDIGPLNRFCTSLTLLNNGNPVGIGVKNAPDLGLNMSDLDYIRFCYYYDGDALTGKRAELVIKESEYNLTKECTVQSLETVVKGEYAYLTFAVRDITWGYIFPEGILPEYEFYPFGKDVKANAGTGEKIYLETVSYWSAGSAKALAAISKEELVHKYAVYFEPGRADVGGVKPETIFAKDGETIVLPENTFTREGFSFKGWVCSEGSVLMQPGDEYTLSKKNILGGVTYNTARTYFVAEWKNNAFGAAELPDTKVVNYSDYTGGIVDYRNYGSYTKNYIFDGINTVRYDIDPTASEASKYSVALDGWQWSALPLDFSKYKHFMILYYYETDGDAPAVTPSVNLLGSSSEANALSRNITVRSKNGNIKANKWDIMSFDIDILNKYPSYIKSEDNTVAHQMHIHPFGSSLKASKLNAGDTLYVGSFIFIDELPKNIPSFSSSYISGFDDGTFRPTDLLTNAQAAAITAKAMGATDAALEKYTESSYSDISQDDWFFGHAAYLEEQGVLTPETGDKFAPDELMTTDEFLKYLVKARSDNRTGTTLGESKLPTSLNTVSITRAAAVSKVNSILKDLSFRNTDSQVQSPFADVTASQWFFADVLAAATDSVIYQKSDSSFRTLSAVPEKNITDANIPEEELQAGEAYVRELDLITEQRISEIRNTPSEYEVSHDGKIIYLSSTDGTTTGTGASANDPKLISSLSEVSDLYLKPGDVVLFKRGDTFRGTMVGKAGVTYSAYGEGEKPLFTRSPENGSGRNKWTLVHEDKETGAKIWRYYKDNYVDVGGLMLIDSASNHLAAYKNIPDYKPDLNGVGTSVTDEDYMQGEENFWVRGAMGIMPFKVVNELDHDLEYVHLAQYITTEDESGADYSKQSLSSNVPTSGAVGPLYLRCDAGNPGTVYPRIEFNLKNTVISASSNGITIDNICIKYFGSHGIGSGKNNLTVTNCEIGWGGGAIQTYNPGKDFAGRVTRFGNGIEIYGGLVNYTIDNCYVYEIYDAGITHQISSSSLGNYFMEGVYYTNNVLTHSTYNIEYFMSRNDVDKTTGKRAPQERFMKDVYFTDNIVRLAGYGWGVQRPDSAPSNIKGWTHHNFATNYVIKDNIFDRCVDLRGTTDYTMQIGTTFESSTAYLLNNIFVQVPGRVFMTFGNITYSCNEETEELLNSPLCGKGNKLYFHPDDKEDYMHHVYWQ